VLDSIFPDEITDVSETEYRVSIQLEVTDTSEEEVEARMAAPMTASCYPLILSSNDSPTSTISGSIPR